MVRGQVAVGNKMKTRRERAPHSKQRYTAAHLMAWSNTSSALACAQASPVPHSASTTRLTRGSLGAALHQQVGKSIGEGRSLPGLAGRAAQSTEKASRCDVQTRRPGRPLPAPPPLLTPPAAGPGTLAPRPPTAPPPPALQPGACSWQGRAPGRAATARQTPGGPAAHPEHGREAGRRLGTGWGGTRGVAELPAPA